MTRPGTHPPGFAGCSPDFAGWSPARTITPAQPVRTTAAAAGSGALPAGRFDLALLSFVLGEIPADRRPAAIQEIAAALRPGGRLAVVEGIFDPHRQSREAVMALTESVGLRFEREDRRLMRTLLVFRKAPAGE